MSCRRCKQAKATGIMFALCGVCFEEWSAITEANPGPDGKYKLSNEESEYLNEGTWTLPDGNVIIVRRPN